MENRCWLWPEIEQGKYKVLSIEGRKRYLHRFIYETANHVRVPDRLVVDHLCKKTACFNPTHLRVCSIAENVMAGDNPAAKRARQTRCNNGHPLSGDNLLIEPQGPNRKPSRRCRECRNARQRRLPRDLHP